MKTGTKLEKYERKGKIKVSVSRKLLEYASLAWNPSQQGDRLFGKFTRKGFDDSVRT
jgi:hypothetical protein